PGPRRTPPSVPPPKSTQRVPLVPGTSGSTASAAPSAAVPIPPPPRMSVGTAPTAQLPVVRSSSPNLPTPAKPVDPRQQRIGRRPTGEPPPPPPPPGGAPIKRATTDPGSPQARRAGQSQAVPVIAPG